MTAQRQFIVIRHGESETNATDTFQAGDQYGNDPLTPRGQQAAEDLARRFASVPVDVIISSGYLRARSTAAMIADATGSPHIIPVQHGNGWLDLSAADPSVRGRRSLLREIDVPTELQGMRFADPRAREVQRLAMAVADHPDAHFSDEENLHDLWRRAEAISHYLEARTEGATVVISHGGILKVWLAHLMFTAIPGLDTSAQLAAYRGFTRLGWWDNTGVVSLTFASDRGWMWLMTDIGHLAPAYFSFMPTEGPVTAATPDTGAEYLR